MNDAPIPNIDTNPDTIQDDGIAIPDLDLEVGTMLQEQCGRWPVRSTYASRLGHPCARYLTYERTCWDHKQLPDARLAAIFHVGRLHGKQLPRDVQDAADRLGYEVEGQEDQIPENPFQIGGRADWILRIPNAEGRRLRVPCEAKSMADHIFANIRRGREGLIDMMTHRAHHVRCYPAQLMAYMYFRNCEVGLFFLRAKGSGELKQVEIRLDLGYMEELLSKAELVRDRTIEILKVERESADWTDNLEANLPPRIDYSHDVCSRCDYRDMCIPDLLLAPGIVNRLGDVEMNTLCWERAGAKAKADTYNKADKAIKESVKSIVAEHMDVPGKQKTVVLVDWALTAKSQRAKNGVGIRVNIDPLDVTDDAPSTD